MGLRDVLRVAGWTVLPNMGSLAGFYVIQANSDDFQLKFDIARRFPKGNSQVAIWTAFNVGMGYSAYLVHRDGGGLDGQARVPIAFYLVSLSCNWAWPAFFYDRTKFAIALLDTVALCCAIGALTAMYRPINTMAAILTLPCLSWSLYVTLFTYRVWKHGHRRKWRGVK
ncbi:translocator protein-like [Ornithodoros turicata]|uniref:translocator protein-like n=1 Tax=Ornithodoros turicata TaxID=34597 RepID=UPI003139B139